MISLTPFIILRSRVSHNRQFLSLPSSFPLLGDDEYDYWKAAAGSAMRRRMGLTENPLDGAVARVRSISPFENAS